MKSSSSASLPNIRSASPSRPRLAALATERLASARAEEAELVPSGTREGTEPSSTTTTTVDAIALAIRSTAQKRKRRRTLTIAATTTASLMLAAAIFLVIRMNGTGKGSSVSAQALTTAVAHSTKPGGGTEGSIIRAGRETSLTSNAPVGLQGGDHVVAKTDTVAIDLSSGTRLSLDPSTTAGTVSLVEVDDLAPTKQSFVLHGGTLHLDVAKLAPNQRFMVRTADVEVEVRGTSFVVESGLAECAGSTTRVRVTEGLVVVRSVHGEARLAPGGVWPSTCATPATGSPPPSPSPSPSPPPTTTTTTAPAAPTTAAAMSAHAAKSPTTTPGKVVVPSLPLPASELAEQNRLYAEATAARRRGANAEAIRAYERFLARYPNGQLAESAAVERMRLLSGSPLATTAARDYLNAYPHGFARDEATKILANTPQ